MVFIAQAKSLKKFAPMEPGEHLLEITEAEVSKSKAGNPMIVVTLRDEKEDKTVRSYVTLTGKAAGHANAFFNAVGVSPKEIKAAGGVHILVGKKVWALTGVDEKDGDRYTKIEDWIIGQDTRTVGPQKEMDLGDRPEPAPTPATRPTPPTPQPVFFPADEPEGGVPTPPQSEPTPAEPVDPDAVLSMAKTFMTGLLELLGNMPEQTAYITADLVRLALARLDEEYPVDEPDEESEAPAVNVEQPEVVYPTPPTPATVSPADDPAEREKRRAQWRRRHSRELYGVSL